MNLWRHLPSGRLTTSALIGQWPNGEIPTVTAAFFNEFFTRGSVAWTEGDDTTAAAGAVSDEGLLGWTEGPDVATISASVALHAALGWTEGADTVAATGAVTGVPEPDYHANIGWTEGGDVCWAVAEWNRVRVNGTTVPRVTEYARNNPLARGVVIRGRFRR